MLAAVVAACAFGLGACRAKPKNFDNENDALRRRVMELERENARILAERNELQAAVNELTRTLEAATGEASADVIASVPRCAGIKLDMLSGLVDKDGVQGAEAADVYIRPFDGRQRFVQVAGTLTVEILHLPDLNKSGGDRASDSDRPDPSTVDAGDANVTRLGIVTLGPRELREAYRSSPLGTHYSVRVELSPKNEILTGGIAGAGLVLARAQFTDAVTGLTHHASKYLE